MNILAFNPGSSTLKFGLYEVTETSQSPAKHSARVLVSGTIEAVGTTQSKVKVIPSRREPVVEIIEGSTPSQSVAQIIQRLYKTTGENKETVAIDAVGCRVVHGGPTFHGPAVVTPGVLRELRALKDLAPLHNPQDVAILEEVQALLPNSPVVAVFDTAFHQTIPAVAHTYALPFELNERYNLRRYGFHGISHSYVSEELIRHLGKAAVGSKVITCHLGSGASICAVRDGKSVDTSMGFTPLEGLVMGTRAGDIDPGLLLYLIRVSGITPSQTDGMLNHLSGLRGLSGSSGDVRDLEMAALEGDERAELALEVFCYRARKYIGAFAAALEGLHGVAFTGGIGEHSATMRKRICLGLDFLGLRLDDRFNNAADGNTAKRISGETSSVQVWVIPTEEEQQIAWSTYEQLRN